MAHEAQVLHDKRVQISRKNDALLVYPHPRFVGNEQYVVFTTTIRGEIDLAIVPTNDLLELSS